MFGDLVDLLVPQACVHCTTPGRVLCDECAGALGGGARRREPGPSSMGLPPAYFVCDYADVARSAILAHKERGVRPLNDALGWALARAVAAAVPRGQAATVIPVPISRARRRAGGDDSVGILARRAVRHLLRLGFDVRIAQPLREVGRRVDQAGLDTAQRRANLQGTYRAYPQAIRGKAVVVDDVITTGATLAEACRALRAAGTSPHAVATVAATRLRVAAAGGWQAGHP